MELEGSFKKHKREGERVRVVQKGVFGVGGGEGVKHLMTWSRRSDGAFVPV